MNVIVEVQKKTLSGEILEYYGSATQIGLTATPKETKDVNAGYFGEAVILIRKQGIEDGLAPYKVIRYVLDKDIGGDQMSCARSTWVY